MTSSPRVNLRKLRSRLGQPTARTLLRPLVRWRPLKYPTPGYSLVVGTPWDMRHLLAVNLRFIAESHRENLHEVMVMFDRRPRPGAVELIAEVGERFPELPLTFHFYPSLSGWITERVGVSTFFNSMNTVLALGRCTSRYAILHDFDLYPTDPGYFETIYRAMAGEGLRFAGAERTTFSGLTTEDNVLGTWGLGMDVPYIRELFTPTQCFHCVEHLRGQEVKLDPYSSIQLRTPERRVIDWGGEQPFCHVKNLCSTYLRFTRGQHAKVAWRLHYLWYLESIEQGEQRLKKVIDAMDVAKGRVLTAHGYTADFTNVDPTCANVLRTELTAMDTALFGRIRPTVAEYVASFARFLGLEQGSVAAANVISGADDC